MSILMKIAGLEAGESSDAHHNDGWMDLVTVHWGMSRRISSATGTRGGRESANAAITDLSITRFMDAASPALFLAACCGRGREVQIAVTKTGQGRGADTFLSYTLHHALVSAYEVDADARDVARPLEQLAVSFADLDRRYTAHDDDGAALAPVSVGFDTTTNVKR